MSKILLYETLLINQTTSGWTKAPDKDYPFRMGPDEIQRCPFGEEESMKTPDDVYEDEIYSKNPDHENYDMEW